MGTFGTNFPRLIVNQFKWLDSLLDSQVGTDGTNTCVFLQSASVTPLRWDEISFDANENRCFLIHILKGRWDLILVCVLFFGDFWTSHFIFFLF